MDKFNTFIFCDETKFYLNNNDHEESIYYLGISIEKKQILSIEKFFFDILKKHRVKSEIFHSKDIFRKKRTRIKLMDELTDFIIYNNLQCFIHKYIKNELFEKTQLLKIFNKDIFNFNNVEFQALFFFVTNLNTYIKYHKPISIQKDISMYFDRNVYGSKQQEKFGFPKEKFIISDMTFCEKSRIKLLFLPDFIGYLLRKSEEYLNFQNENTINKNAYKNFLKIQSSNNIHFINVNTNIIEKSINKIVENE